MDRVLLRCLEVLCTVALAVLLVCTVSSSTTTVYAGAVDSLASCIPGGGQVPPYTYAGYITPQHYTTYQQYIVLVTLVGGSGGKC